MVYGIGETPDGHIRYQWLKEAYPQHDIRLVANLFTDDEDSGSSLAWAQYTKQILKEDMPDVVFSSEDYGLRWATAMHCEHVMVDRHRSLYAISGTQIRADIYGYWHMIHPIARRTYVKKILLVGAESVGKTTLAINLAKHYGTYFVPEYGRIYVEENGIDDDVKREIFPAILNEQPRMEEETLKIANKILICDTDLYTTYLWHQKWQEGDSLGELILQEAERRHTFYDLVFLCDHVGTDWIDDGLRDQKDTRAWFTSKLDKYYFQKHHHKGYCLTGNWDERWEKAIDRIENLLSATSANRNIHTNDTGSVGILPISTVGHSY